MSPVTGLPGLDLSVPIVAAAMAGGPTTPELVVAAARAGGLGLLAGGYRTADDLDAQVVAVRAGSETFGVNLFAPNPSRVDAADYARYRDLIRAEAAALGASVPDAPIEDDDHWQDKIDLLTSTPVPVVTFTFGVPDAGVVGALHRAGSLLVQTVTSADEARLAAQSGVDVLAVQASAAGGHSGTLTPSVVPEPTPLRELLAQVRQVTDLPVIAAGGLADPREVAAVIADGAAAVMVGTALLLTPEAGTSDTYRSALRGPDRGDTVVTRAFTGRPARALRNSFVDAHDAEAPAGYPALHHLTRPMRRAAGEAGDPEYVNLWAGTGYRAISERPAAEILTSLAAQL